MSITAGTTARGLPYPGHASAADVPTHIKALADAIETMNNSPLVLGSSLIAVNSVQVQGATEGVFNLLNSAGSLNRKRSRLQNTADHTRLQSVNDAYSAEQSIGFSFDHATGGVDFPNGATVGGVAPALTTDSRFPAGADISLGDLSAALQALLVPNYFSAYRSAALSVATNGDVPFDTQEADTPNDRFDPLTGRFTPGSGELWRLSWRVGLNVPATIGAYLYKNTTLERRGTIAPAHTSVAGASTGTALVVGDGTSYYKVVVTHDTGGSAAVAVSAPSCYFQGERVG